MVITLCIILLLLPPLQVIAQDTGNEKFLIEDFDAYYKNFKPLLDQLKLEKVIGYHNNNLDLLQLTTLVNTIKPEIRLEFFAFIIKQGWKIHNTYSHMHFPITGTFGIRDETITETDKQDAGEKLSNIPWNIAAGDLILNHNSGNLNNSIAANELILSTDGNILVISGRYNLLICPSTPGTLLYYDLALLDDIAAHPNSKYTYLFSKLARSINLSHLNVYMNFFHERYDPEGYIQFSSLGILKIIIQCGKPGVKRLLELYNLTNDNKLKADIGFAFTELYKAAAPIFKSIDPELSIYNFLNEFIFTSSIHKEASTSFKKRFSANSYYKKISSCFNILLERDKKSAPTLCIQILGKQNLFILYPAAYTYLSKLRDEYFEDILFMILNSEDPTKIDEKMYSMNICRSTIASLGVIGDQQTLDKLKVWAGSRQLSTFNQELLNKVYQSIENKIKYNTGMYSTVLSEIDYGFQNSRIINILAYHPINLLDKDSDTSCIVSDKKVRFTLFFENQFMIDEIILYKSEQLNFPTSFELSFSNHTTTLVALNLKECKIINLNDRIIIQLKEPFSVNNAYIGFGLKGNFEELFGFHTMEFKYQNKIIEIQTELYFENSTLY